MIAVDIGNARIKLGLFAERCAADLPEPLQTLSLDGDSPELADIRESYGALSTVMTEYLMAAKVKIPKYNNERQRFLTHEEADQFRLICNWLYRRYY